MTEKRQLPEQIALHTYKYTATSRRNTPVGYTPTERRQLPERAESASQREQPGAASARSLQRVVTVPRADPSHAWNTFAERQEQRRRARSRVRSYTGPIARTYVQTGMRASSGRIKAVRRLPQYDSSPVPVRSGRRAGRGGWLWKLLSIFAVLIVLVLGANFVFASNAFRIEQVNVLGTHNSALIQNIQRMGMQGQNIFLIDVASLTERVEADPLVASASLSKQWPNQITISVVERKPTLLWQSQQGTYSVDAQGVVIAPASAVVGSDRPMTVIDGRGSKSTVLHPGARVDQAAVQFALVVFNRLPALTGIKAFTLRYGAAGSAHEAASRNEEDSFTVESADGWKAYLGTAHDSNSLDNRLIELQQVLTLAQKQRLTLATIDVRYGQHAVYTLKS